MMAEMYGKHEGCSRGRGGSMHLFDARHALLRRQCDRRRRPAGGGGAGAGGQDAGRRAVTACFFGDGAVAEGEFHEIDQPARALAAAGAVRAARTTCTPWGRRWRRPVGDRPRAQGGGVRDPARSVDGMDVWRSSGRTARRRRDPRGRRPALPRMRTYRFRAHSMFDPELYRDQGRNRGSGRSATRSRAVQRLLSEARPAARGRASPRSRPTWRPRWRRRWPSPRPARCEPVAELERFVLTRTRCRHDRDAAAESDHLPRGLREAIREAMIADPRVFLMGEDVGRYGGCYAVSKGLLTEFGPETASATRRSPRAAFVGAGIGAAHRRHAPDRRDHDGATSACSRSIRS